MSKAVDDVSHSSPERENNLAQQKVQLNSGKQPVGTNTKKPPFKHGDQRILASRPDFAHSQLPHLQHNEQTPAQQHHISGFSKVKSGAQFMEVGQTSTPRDSQSWDRNPTNQTGSFLASAKA
ncbi:hypothetical protein V6N11_009064 [Hibiscus sabdariffa]|uniref:Uncharacterized protein n=1 Tax=Hibiscus sabdariffa TaxID=183260 RepID=A0ABR2PQ38_9ROSI